MQNTALKTDSEPAWHFDSGCGKHMTGNKANLLNYKKVRNGPLIRFAGGDSHPTIGMGDVQIGNTLVQGVLFVQDLEYNLFSMSQFTDKGYTVKIKSNECKLIDDESKQVVLIAKRT